MSVNLKFVIVTKFEFEIWNPKNCKSMITKFKFEIQNKKRLNYILNS